MKYLLLFIIKIYWVLIPRSKRRKCIFRISCSKYVYDIAMKKGVLQGIKALSFRINNCKHGFELFENPITKETQMILPNHQLIEEKDIALRLMKEHKIHDKK